MTPEELEQRWADAIAVGELHKIRCTGAPRLHPACEMFAAITIILYGRLFAAPCREHLVPLINEVAKSGYAAGLRCVALADLVERPTFEASAESIRAKNLQHGVIIPRPQTRPQR